MVVFANYIKLLIFYIFTYESCWVIFCLGDLAKTQVWNRVPSGSWHFVIIIIFLNIHKLNKKCINQNKNNMKKLLKEN
jgi:hypothetical protein